MKSRATSRFWKLYRELPAEVQAVARKNFQLWLRDPHHPSLSFKKLRGGGGMRFSVRVGDHYRAIGLATPETGIEWVWIGSHEDYNRLTK